MTIKGTGSIGAWLTGLTLVLALLLIATRPAQAQTETVLYNFCPIKNCPDGDNPDSRLTSDGKGNFYGTTYAGGWALEPYLSFRRTAAEAGTRPCSTASLEGRMGGIQVTLT